MTQDTAGSWQTVLIAVAKEGGLTVYEIKDMTEGEKAELKITADGKLIRIKRCEED